MLDSYLKLSCAALLPSVLAVIIHLFRKTPLYKHVNKNFEQLILGVLFGGLAIIGTEWGIPLVGVQVNCRDAAVLCAGLFYGGPAGILAGIIGAAERWIGVAWGLGTFTRVACCVSTFLAGIYAAALRKYILEQQQPGVFLSLTVGVIMEIFHMTMVILTNMDNARRAVEILQASMLTMVVANGLSVMLAGILINLLTNGRRKRSDLPSLFHQIQRRLLAAVVMAFVLTTAFVVILQYQNGMSQAEATLKSRLINGEVLIKGDAVVDVSNQEPDKLFQTVINGEVNLCMYQVKPSGTVAVAVILLNEAMMQGMIVIYVNTFMEVLVFSLLFVLIYRAIGRSVLHPLRRIKNSLAQIASGHLEETAHEYSSEEFYQLSGNINETVGTLRRYISEAEEHNKQEMDFARQVQASVLPSIETVASRTDVSLYAFSDPAREVGGDFYDFYTTSDKSKFHFMIADVSGKGIPAAMFMMRAKATLKGLAEEGMDTAAVLSEGNSQLCSGNKAGMFVTVWQGCLDIQTGHVTFANAGHNPPAIRRGREPFELLKMRTNLVLGGMKGVPYRLQEFDLQPGDCVVLYTDGVTEALDKKEELYGETRLLEALNAHAYVTAEQIANAVRRDVKHFAGTTPQTDDMTMLVLIYNGPEKKQDICAAGSDNKIL